MKSPAIIALLLFISLSLSHSSPLLYLSPSVFHLNYQRMLSSFKIYIYSNSYPLSFASPVESLFVSSLQNSPFVTLNPHHAHLFFVPFPSHLSTRQIARLIRDLRTQFPFWNRTLGADHFYVSSAGLAFESDRDLVELKKNSVQISPFPAPRPKFVPRKDITLPPLASSYPVNRTARLGTFVKRGAVKSSDFLAESEPSDEKTLLKRLAESEFCLFEDGADISGIGQALRFGCVPVVVSDRPMQDLPFVDVIRWREIAVVVGPSGGVDGVKRLVESACGGGGDDKCDGMRRLGVAASQHLVWNEKPEPYDAFHMVMYQLWLRRHTIRYARWDLSAPD